MFVGMWMTKDVITVTADTLVTEIAVIMSQRRIRRLPVILQEDEISQLLGLVSSQNVLHAFPPDINPLNFFSESNQALREASTTVITLTAKDVMVTNPIVTSPETPIEEVAQLMRDKKIGSLPVMRHGTLVGIITESDLFRAFADIFDPGSHGVRITFDNSRGEDVFPMIAEVTHHHRLRVTSFVSLLKHERPVCVVQVIGTNTEAMLNDIWKSNHQIVSVVHLDQPEQEK